MNLHLKNHSVLLLIAFCMLAIGFFSAAIAKAYSQNSSKTVYQEASLPGMLQLELENEQLAKENENLLKELAKLKAGESDAVLASKQLEEASINSGLVPLAGPGIIITLDDSTRNRNTETSNYVIHEEYLCALVNILWHGGAEAIAINNQRITAHTEIFCNGAFIQINGTRQMPPYRIVAIGNQESLKSALQFYNFWDKLGEYQQEYGITRELEVPVKPVTVPAAEKFNYIHIQPLKEG